MRQIRWLVRSAAWGSSLILSWARGQISWLNSSRQQQVREEQKHESLRAILDDSEETIDCDSKPCWIHRASSKHWLPLQRRQLAWKPWVGRREDIDLWLDSDQPSFTEIWQNGGDILVYSSLVPTANNVHLLNPGRAGSNSASVFPEVERIPTLVLYRPCGRWRYWRQSLVSSFRINRVESPIVPYAGDCAESLTLYDAPWADDSKIIKTFCDTFSRAMEKHDFVSTGNSLFVKFESKTGSYSGYVSVLQMSQRTLYLNY